MRLSSLFAVALTGSVLTAAAHAQSPWGVHGPTSTAIDFSGPPAACGYPTGPVIGNFNYAVPFACPTAGAFPGPAATAIGVGDITVDRTRDNVWITDGNIVTGYTKAGVPIASFPNPLPGNLTGLGWSLNPFGVGSLLWLTNGFLVQAFQTPAPGCAFPIAAIGAWAVPFAGLAQDVDVDPVTMTVFIGYANGLVSNHTMAGGVGPFGLWAPAVACLLPNITGLAIDTASCKVMYLTDGFTMTRVDMTGGIAPPTFYAPAVCWPVAGPGGISGLGFDATPVPFGNGCDPAGPPPVAGTVLEALTPNPGFGLTVTGAAPGGGAFLLIGAAPACPPIPVGFGCAINVFPLAAIVGPIPVPATGNFGLPAAIPAGLGCSGATAYIQWLIAKPMGGLQTTQALHVRPAVP